MVYTNEIKEYFAGNKFDNGYRMNLKNNPLYSRIEMLCQIVKGKRVIHVGCCDHLPLIEHKIKNHSWLQGRLDECCSEVIGFDISEEAVEFVNKNHFSKSKVVCTDITQDKLNEYGDISKFDYVLLGEIIEHVDNPIDFLTKARCNLERAGFHGQYIVTLPNSFCIQKGIYRKAIENINTDHRYWFTPYTAGKILYCAGIEPEEIFFVDYLSGFNGSNYYTNLIFRFIKKMNHGVPSKYKSYRGSQLIVIGKSL